jgi:glycerophosphoryl diester phosphodiesterase
MFHSPQTTGVLHVPARLVIAALLAAAALVAGSLLTAPAAAAGTACVPPPVAHRGDSERAPENTYPAFAKALAAGVRRLELDVRFSHGDVPVLMHDPTVDRTTNGTGEVSALTLDQIRALDAGSWFGTRYRGTRVPTLFEVLKLAKSKGANVMTELKTQPTEAQMAQFLDRVRWLSMSRDIIVTSFSEDTITAVRAAVPDLRTAIIDGPGYREPASVLEFGRTYVVNAWSVTRTRTATWRRAGINVRAWTVDSLKGWSRMANDQAGAVITNRPTSYLAWARARCR